MTTRTTATKAKGPAKKRAWGPNDAHAKVLKVIALYAKGGQGIKACCKSAEISWPSFSDWLEKDADLAAQYARARARADEIEFEALAEIADEEPPVDAMGKRDSAWVAWQRGRIDVRKWMLARKQPSKYGERQHIEHSGKVSLENLVAGDDDPGG
jgi:hypothetical protein